MFIYDDEAGVKKYLILSPNTKQNTSSYTTEMAFFKENNPIEKGKDSELFPGILENFIMDYGAKIR